MTALTNAYLAWATWHETDEDGDRLARILETKTRPPIKKIMVAAWMPNSRLVTYHEPGCKAIAQKFPFGDGWPDIPFACQNCGERIEALDQLLVEIQIWDGEVAA